MSMIFQASSAHVLSQTEPSFFCAKFFPFVLVALAAKRPIEPAIALCWVRLGNNGVPRNQQREEGDVKRRGRASALQGRSEHVPPAGDCGLAYLVAAGRPEKGSTPASGHCHPARSGGGRARPTRRRDHETNHFFPDPCTRHSERRVEI